MDHARNALLLQQSQGSLNERERALLDHYQQRDSDDEEAQTPAEDDIEYNKPAKFPTRPCIRYVPAPELCHQLLMEACKMQHPELENDVFSAAQEDD